MNAFKGNNKLCGVHWLKQPIEDLIIKIHVKRREGVNKLPKIQDYQLKSDEENLEKLSNYNFTDYIFKWQEKVFSPSEVEKYSEEHNCFSDTELHYYDLIKGQNYNKNNIFTYVHSDCHLSPLPFDSKKLNESNILNLNVCFEKLNLGKKIFGLDGDSGSLRHLFRSEENLHEDNEQWRSMQIVLDSSEYDDPSEVEKYSQEHNCFSDTELHYYDLIKGLNYNKNKIFTYVHSDCHLSPLPFDSKKLNESNILNLNVCFEKLNLGKKIFVLDGDSSSLRHLFRSEENLHEDNEQWRSMQIVLDSSEYDENSKLIFKEEHILLRLHHNVYHNYLVVSPDVNDIHTNSYHINGVLGFEYGVEIEFGGESGEDMAILLNHLLNKWNKKYKQLLSFATPPLGHKTFYLRFEIVSAAEFDMDNIYIEYHIKIPDTLKHTGDLTGRTHCSKTLNAIKNWRYGHNLELELECATGIDPEAIKIYLEAISVDWWGRHRTEGYTYLALSLQPGCYTDHLSCSRPEERNPVVADSRRFFVGGCHLLKDLNVLDNPQLKDPNIRFTSTGTIFVRWHVISHSSSPSLLPPTPHSSSSALLKGAEAVLKQYKKAKETLAIATGLALDESGDE